MSTYWNAEEVLSEVVLKSFWSSEKNARICVVAVWQRDCDMVEGTDVHTFELPENDLPTAVVSQIHELWNRTYDWAEGPVSIWVMSEEEYNEHREDYDGPRDRIMEAWENGDGTKVLL